MSHIHIFAHVFDVVAQSEVLAIRKRDSNFLVRMGSLEVFHPSGIGELVTDLSWKRETLTYLSAYHRHYIILKRVYNCLKNIP